MIPLNLSLPEIQAQMVIDLYLNSQIKSLAMVMSFFYSSIIKCIHNLPPKFYLFNRKFWVFFKGNSTHIRSLSKFYYPKTSFGASLNVRNIDIKYSLSYHRSIVNEQVSIINICRYTGMTYLFSSVIYYINCKCSCYE